MASDGFTAYGCVSEPLAVKEGQVLLFRFRGNVTIVPSGGDVGINNADKLKVVGQAWSSYEKNTADDGNDSLKVVYNSHIKSECVFKVRVVDKYSQKALDSYRGFVQIYTENEKKTDKVNKRIAFAENSFASTSSYSCMEENGEEQEHNEMEHLAQEDEEDVVEGWILLFSFFY